MTIFNKIHILSPTAENVETRIIDLIGATSIKPFSRELLDFVADFSKDILLDRRAREYPELMALAHWFRMPHLNSMRSDFFEKREKKTIRAKGVIFHLAPSNVDTVFVYSWFISLLCGNKNIIRVSRDLSPQVLLILEKLSKFFSLEKYSTIGSTNVVLTYDHSDEVTSYLSSICDCRVIWGGDATVNRIRSIPLPPRSSELTFANRTALAIFESENILNLPDGDLNRVVRNFYNDTFWFGQQACSSPRSVIWVGSPSAIEKSRNLFWPLFEKLCVDDVMKQGPSDTLNRFAALCSIAIVGETDLESSSLKQLPMRAKVDVLDDQTRLRHCGTGLFWEVFCTNPQDVKRNIDPMDQTAVVQGFNSSDIETLVGNLADIGVHRIVSPGRALEFGPVWDGYDLYTHFTRETILNL